MKLLSKHPLLKLLLWPCISLLLIPLSLWIASEGNALLGQSNLQFRPWVRFALFIIFMLSIVSLLVSIIFFIIRALRHSYIITVWKKRVAWFSGILSSVIIGIVVLLTCVYGVMLLNFMYESEHIVTQNGTKAVARVVKLTDTTVFYYEYHGPFVMGAELLSYEPYRNPVE
ncbi:MAG: hypothetical protein J6B06_03335 [Lachnospiraceae bacterium]|nr:hypothetical protein [Lachnospiraceae bacterium]